MTSPLQSLIASGTKLWLDSIDPDLVVRNRALGATGATSNPIILSDLIKTGRFDRQLEKLMQEQLEDADIAWRMTDELVRGAQKEFLPVWRETRGNDGYVSFELDPLLEDPQLGPPHAKRVAKYIELAKHWSAGHDNRMIKVPATAGGPGSDRGNGGARHHDQRDAMLHDAAVSRRPRGHLARRPAARASWTASRASTASSSRGSTCTPNSTCPLCRRPPRVR